MKIDTYQDEPPPTAFECFDNWLSKWISQTILSGQTYPRLPGVDDVHTIVDVGANCGATSVYFARCYPGATVHSVEPAARTYELLSRNAAAYPNIRTHNVGLYSVDDRVPLYAGKIDAGTASIFQREQQNSAQSEEIVLRETGRWLTEQGIDSIDLLKVDAEGCEPEILEGVGELLEGVSVVYLEYDSAEARRRIGRLLEPTHELAQGLMYLNQGEMIYVARRVVESDDAIAEFFLQRVAAEASAGIRGAS